MPIAPPPLPAVQLDAALRLNERGWPPFAGRSTAEPPRPSGADGTIASRQCGRCRATFPADPTLDPFALPEWWLCPPCRLALLGQQSRGAGTATGVHRAH